MKIFAQEAIAGLDAYIPTYQYPHELFTPRVRVILKNGSKFDGFALLHQTSTETYQLFESEKELVEYQGALSKASLGLAAIPTAPNAVKDRKIALVGGAGKMLGKWREYSFTIEGDEYGTQVAMVNYQAASVITTSIELTPGERNALCKEIYLLSALDPDKPAVGAKVKNPSSTIAGKAKRLPGMQEIVKDPIEGLQRPLFAIIMTLNDEYHWTREKIADWLETLDIDLTFPVLDKEPSEGVQ